MSYTHRDILEEELKNILSQNINRFKNILEIGAGHCPQKQLLLSYNEGAIYTSIDNGDQYIDNNNINQDAHSIQFPDESFDLVFLSHTTEHFVNPVRALNEIYRVLTQNGIVISITPNCCRHQILEGDRDHLFVLNEMQWIRLFKHIKFSAVTSYTQTEWKGQLIPKEQDYNIFTIAQK
jgi:SAM-dependent methyltransferase